MEHDEKKFAFDLSIKEKVDTSRGFYIRSFASAATPEEAIANLAEILDGTRPFRQIVGKGGKASSLKVVVLMGLGNKKLITLPVLKEGRKYVSVDWGRATFHEVDKHLMSALMSTFPEQKQIFKGKALEEALGL